MSLSERFGLANLLDLEPWQMSRAERAYFVLLVSQFRPRFALEVGSGASTVVLAEFSERVVVIDPFPSELLEPIEQKRFSRRDGVRVVKKMSQHHLARELEPEVDFVLIDGNHDPNVVRGDVEQVLAHRPATSRLLLMHDSANPACRSGLEAVDWAGCPWVHHHDLDLLVAPVDNPEWGGFAIAHLYSEPSSP